MKMKVVEIIHGNIRTLKATITEFEKHMEDRKEKETQKRGCSRAYYSN